MSESEQRGNGIRDFRAEAEPPHNPDEDLPGYWIGFVAGMRRTAGRALADLDRAREDVQQVSDDLAAMHARGRQWEAATMRMAETRAAAARAVIEQTRALPPVAPGAELVGEDTAASRRRA